MANNTSLVTQLTGQAWVRSADGTLNPIHHGMRIPVDADVVTASGASVQLQTNGQPLLTIGENRDVNVGAEVAQADVDPTTAAATPPADPDVARVLTALQSGDDPFQELDPTAAVIQGGPDGAGGSSFTRVAAILEVTTPLGLEYPRPTFPGYEEVRLGGTGSNRAPELTGIGLTGAGLLDQVNDDSDIVSGLNVGTHFADPDGHTLTFTATGLPPGLTLNPNTGIIEGTLDSSASQGGPGGDGVYNVVITATDPYGASVSLPFTWTTNNPPPVAENDAATTDENVAVTGNVLTGDPATGEGRDLDPDGDKLTVTEITNADGGKAAPGTPIVGVNADGAKGGGTFTINPDGSYSFDPGTDFDYLAVGESTTTEVTYTISDGDGGFDTATLTITVTGSNDAPVIVAGGGTDDETLVTEIEDGESGENVITHEKSGEITFFDADESDTHEVTLKPAASDYLGDFSFVVGDNNTIAWNFKVDDSAIDYLAKGQTLTQEYVITVTDKHGAAAQQTVTVTIVGTNDAPVIDADSSQTTGAVVEEGTDPTTSGNLVWTDADTRDTHTWTAHDDGLGKYGQLTINDQGQWVYTLDNGRADHLAEGTTVTDTITVTVHDGNGGTDTQDIVVTITGANDIPVISGDTVATGTVKEAGVKDGNVPEPGTPEVSGKLLATDPDDGAELSWSLKDPQVDDNYVSTLKGDYGSITLDPISGEWTYTLDNEARATQQLNNGDTRTDTFTARVQDEHGAWSDQLITVTIEGTNDLPVLSEDKNFVKEAGVKPEGNDTEPGKTKAEGNVLTGEVQGASGSGKDTDIDSDTLTVTGVTLEGQHADSTADGLVLQGKYGTLVMQSDGSYVYTLDNNAANHLSAGKLYDEVFTYSVSDGDGATASTNLTITVNGTNDAPIITQESVLVGSVTEQGEKNPDQAITVKGQLDANDVDDVVTDKLTWNLHDGNGLVDKIDGIYGHITLNKDTGEWVYTLDNTRPATQALTGKDHPEEIFNVRVTDEFGAYDEKVIKVTVNGSNDAPTADQNVVITFDEDPTYIDNGGQTQGGYAGNIITDHTNNFGEGPLAVIDFTINGHTTTIDPHNASPVTVTIPGAGSFTMDAQGNYIFKPLPDYSGEVPKIEYTVQEPGAGRGEDDLTAKGDLQFVITPVADKPILNGQDSAHTPEDVAVKLGLVAPEVKDATDHNNIDGVDLGGDNPELLGIITLSGIPEDAVLQYEGGGHVSVNDGTVQIVIVEKDGKSSHTQDALDAAKQTSSAIITMTKEQYESLTVLPKKDDGSNFKLTVSVDSHEVDDHGRPLSDVEPANDTKDIDIDVKAVTDDVALKFKDGVTGQFTTNEDTKFDLTAQLEATFEDLDGSEQRDIVISGLPKGSTVFVDGKAQTIGDDGSVKIDATGQTGGINSFPKVEIRPPANFSGDIKGITVTLNAKDTDTDSTHDIAPKSASVVLDLHVNPIAGDISVGGAGGKEDSAIKFLAGIKLTDKDGSEIITKLAIKGIPKDWIVKDSENKVVTGFVLAVDEDGNETKTYTLDASSGKVDLDAYKGWTVTPPAHSSKDATFKVDVTTVDTKVVNGTTVTHTDVKTDVALKVTVKPVAEKVGVDSDSDGKPDLTMTAGHKYADVVGGKEDEWFALNVSGQGDGKGFNLKDGWSNQDGRPAADSNNSSSKDGGTEQTFALLKPVLVDGISGETAAGSKFSYIVDGTEVILTYNGTDPVEIPMEYLDTVKFQGPPNVSGKFDIEVQAKTVDTDPDGGYTDTAISGNAKLEGIFIAPVADPVTLGVRPAHGKEDSDIQLFINPTSADASEKFNVEISNIPAGVKLLYDGKEVQVANGIARIDGFDSTKPLFVRPLHNSNEDLHLQVKAQSVDASPGGETSISEWETQDLHVRVDGVADDAAVVFKPLALTEDAFGTQVDGKYDNTIKLSDVVGTVTMHDSDTSETLTFKITGLPDGFTVEGATFMGGEEVGREWVFTQKQLANITIKVPEHYSGKLPGTLTPITTENDGDSKTGMPQEWDVTITPVPESDLTAVSTLVEDKPSKVDFSIANDHGDQNEALTAVWIKVGDVEGKDFSLFLGKDGTTTLAQAAAANHPDITVDGDYYKVTGDSIKDIYAQAGDNFANNLRGAPSLSFDVKYEVTDYSNDGALSESAVQAGKHVLEVTPVTDLVALTLANDGAQNVAQRGEFSIAITLAKEADANANGAPDHDGSEAFTQLIISGVPNGMLVNGLTLGNTTVGNVSFLGNGKWLVSIPDAEHARFAGPIDAQINFTAGALLGSGPHNLEVTVVTQDTGAANVESATESVEISTSFTGGGGEAPAEVTVDFQKNDDFTGTEDQAFTLDQAFTGTVDQDDTNFTLTLKLPAGATVTQDGRPVTPTLVGDEEVWVLNGKGDQAALDAFLKSIEVTPPANMNDNHVDGMPVDATLTAYLDNGSQSQGEVASSLPLTPVTDDPHIDIVFSAADADGNPTKDDAQEGRDVAIQLTVGNAVDVGSTFGDSVYIKLTEDNGLANGSLTNPNGSTLKKITVDADNDLGLQAGDYYVADLPAGTDSINLTYTPAPGQEFKDGTITVDAWVQSQEQGAANKVVAGSSQTGVREAVNNGYDITVGTEAGGGWVVTGAENQAGNDAIVLDIGGNGLLDTDSSETVTAAMLKNLPNGFLVYVDGQLASNAGAEGDGNNWLIPIGSDGKLPVISVVPPQNWSGTLAGVELSILSGEQGQQTWGEPAKFDLVVQAKADGIQSFNPAPAFRTADGIIHLNLNLTMKDGALVENTTPDASVETVTLTLKGLGEHALFFVGTALHSSGIAYDFGSDTYTLTGLSQGQVDSLGVVQTGDAAKGTIEVTAKTVESGSGDVSAQKTGTFDLSIVDQDPAVGTDGDDIIIGKAGNDTLSGGAGNDIIYGGAGDDILIGGRGDDILIGGTGDDTFKWNAGDQGSVDSAAVDIIRDFGNGNDKLDLSELLVGEETEGADLTQFLHLSEDGLNTIINVNTQGGLKTDGAGHDQQIILENVRLSDLMADGASSTQSEMIQNLIQSGKLQVDQ